MSPCALRKGSSSWNQTRRQTLVKYINTKIGETSGFLSSLEVFLCLIGSVQSDCNCRTWRSVAGTTHSAQCWRTAFAASCRSCLAKFGILYLLNKARNDVLSALVPSTGLGGTGTGKNNQWGINIKCSGSTDCYKFLIPQVREQPEFSLASLLQI